MIVSVHIRKCAGTTFKTALRDFYGDRVMFDYGDEIGSNLEKSVKKRARRYDQVLANKGRIAADYDIIHGHFFAHKYQVLDTDLRYATVLRHPVERVLSNYFYLKRNPDRQHGDAYLVNELGYDLEQYIEHPDSQNLQTHFLGDVALSDFAFVGISEQYVQTLQLFNATFGANLALGPAENQNTASPQQYDIGPALRSRIEQVNASDMALYHAGAALFQSAIKGL
mmetsp:Transcript_23988/g.43909  ORF Transcript_23988/g.43909 Transcript_23988/m.43909 type:complete len:225 (-) Transcript_23988:3402-4076(-)